MTPKIEIVKYLNGKGIMTVGFCNAEPMVDYAFFVAKEHQGKGNYFDVGHNKELSDDSWYNPKKHLPKAKSIITILLPYNLKLIRQEQKPALAISKSSLFKDYHVTMQEQLDDLSDFIETRFDKKSIGFSDTGPLNDKAVLLKTGTVQLLRNSLLYHKDYGSRFYIGYLITELNLGFEQELVLKSTIVPNAENPSDYKSIFTNIKKQFLSERVHPYCENCGRCAKACPNKAIEEHGHLTSHNCISFLTQSKSWEDLSEDLTLNGYVYGCDICQLVCPLNGKNLDNYTYESVIDEDITIEKIESLTNREFKAIYNKSSAGWIGKKRFLRNAKWNRDHK